ncbi:MAG TPA: ADP-glyceromanno-heptose 6-epimerase [Azospirillaceae bacterium]|nr:ADP-glyceromanno-heptose 6-epimerase [Azospirillaceae bacterium]
MIVVTGGAGFIGSNLVAGLEARGITDVAVVDRLGTDEKWRNIAKRELRSIVAPERLFDFLDAYQETIDAVFHMGAISATTERDADLIVSNNINLTQALWQWCARHGVRLIYASSAATYGDGLQGFDDDASPDALAKLRPLNAYGWSKHVLDRWAIRAIQRGERTPPQWAGLKFFNVYGPNETHKGAMASVVSHLHPKIMAGEPARLFKSHRPGYEDGGQLRDFVWVGDVVDVMLWLLDTPSVSGLFNVGSGQARSFRDLATATFSALGRTPAIEYFDMPESLREKYQYFTQANMTKLRDAGYPKQFTSLEEGVRQYVQNYLSASDPYR